jgi:large subunit ribosomal protein L25
MEELVLKAQRRDGRGKGFSRRIRAKGGIPVVMYGEGENLALVVDSRELRKLLTTEAGANALVRLNVEGEESVDRLVMVRDLQSDPVRGEFVHADLLRISMDREVEVEVPIELEGEPVGVVQDDGHLGQLLSVLSVRCLPNAIPSSVKADVSEMGIGDVLHVSDLQVPSGVAVVTDPEEAVANVTVVTVELEAVPVEAEAVVAEGEEAAAEAPSGEKKEGAEGAKEEPSEG